MSGPVLLPAPLASSSVTLGQLLVDPLNPEYKSYTDVSSPKVTPLVQSNYENVFSHDDQGRLLSHVHQRSPSDHHNVILVQAEQMSYAALPKPSEAFEALRRTASSQSFLHKMALQNRPLYYVTGIQKLKNPSFRRAVVKEGSIAEIPASPDTKIQLPTHVRRDSALELEETDNDAVFGVELRKVRCRVGSPSEPHAVEDIGYEWSYHKLDGEEDLQLAIGLGRALEGAELRALVGIVSNEDFTDDSYESDDFDDEGLAGF